MTSKYAPQRQVPEGFPEELRFFTREALRNWSLEHGAAPDSREWLMQVRSHECGRALCACVHGQDVALASSTPVLRATTPGAYP